MKKILFSTIGITLFLVMLGTAQAAAPTFTIKTHSVNNSSAVVVLTFSESVTTNTNNDTALIAGDFTIGGTDGLSISSIGHVVTQVGSKYVVLTMSGNINVAGAGEVTVACAADAIYNSGDEACAQGATDVNGTNDSTAPSLSNAMIMDVSGGSNGKVDLVYFTYDEPVKVADQSPGYDDAARWSLAAGGHTGASKGTVLVGRNYGGASGCYDGNTICLNVTEGSVANTAVDSMTYTYSLPSAGSRISDMFGNEIAAGYTAVAPADGAAPFIKFFRYLDNDGNGKIDRITVMFTESVVAASVLSANDLTFNNVGDFTGAAFGANGADLITDTVSSVTVTLGTEATAVDTGDSGAIAIWTQNAASFVDGSSNTNANVGSQTQASYSDGAAPLLKILTTYDGNGNGKVDAADLVFSENIDDSTDTTAANWEIGDTDAQSVQTATCDGVTDTDADDEKLCIKITTVGNEVNGTNLKTVDYTGSNLADMSIAANTLVTGNDLGLTKTDGAVPIFFLASYLDLNTDGTVDQIVVTFSENMTLDEYDDADWTIVGGTVNLGNESAAAADGVNINLTVAGNALTTGGTVAPTVAYTAGNGTANSANDGNGNNVATFTAQTVSDEAAPIAKLASTLDNNNDGTVDFIKILYTESILDSTVAGSDFQAGIADTTAGNLTESFTALTPSSGNATDTANDAAVYIGVASSGETISALKTDYTLKVQQTGAITDASANSYAGFVAQTSLDGAKPIIKTVQIEDAAGNNGLIDKLVLTWTENVDTDDGEAPVAGDLPVTVLPDSESANFGAAVISDPAGASPTVTITGITGQLTVLTSVGSIAISGDLSAKWKDTAATPNTPHATSATGNESVIDAAKPIITGIVFSQDGTSGRNKAVFAFSEAMYIDNTNQDGTMDDLDTRESESIASAANFGNIDDLGSIEGFGNFGTAGTVNESSDTADYWTVSANGASLTMELAYATNSYLVVTSVAAPSGAFTPDDAAFFLAQAGSSLANKKINTSATPTPSGSWDLTKPTVSSAVVADSNSDGKIDQITMTASETLRTVASSADTIDDWTLTGNTNEFGTNLSISSAYSVAGSATYSAVFSGANIYYDAAALTLQAAADEWSMADRAGNILATTSKVCMTGYACTGGTANYALMTMNIVKPGGGGDTVIPGKPTEVAAERVKEGVKLTWKDPLDSDLSSIIILRGKNGAAITGTPYGAAAKGIKEYLDVDIKAGETVSYILKATDKSGNASGLSETVSITVTKWIEPVVEEPKAGEEPSSGVEEEPEKVFDEETPEQGELAEPELGELEPEDVEVPEIVKIFADLAETTWAHEAVEALYKIGVIKGKSEGSFAPADNLRRSEAAAMLYRVYGLEEPVKPEKSPFKDIKTSDWFAGYVSYLKDKGILEGNPDGTFTPGKEINRAEFLTIIMRVYEAQASAEVKAEIKKLREGGKTDHYADLEDGWYTQTVTIATGLGIVEGNQVGDEYYFNANSTINRAEAAQMIKNAFY